MFKKFIRHPFLKKATFFNAVLFLLLIIYHCIRFYIVQPDCAYIKSSLNISIEFLIVPTAFIGLLLTLTQLIAIFMSKEYQQLIYYLLGFVLLILFGIGYVYNTILECFLSGMKFNFNGAFLAH